MSDNNRVGSLTNIGFFLPFIMRGYAIQVVVTQLTVEALGEI